MSSVLNFFFKNIQLIKDEKSLAEGQKFLNSFYDNTEKDFQLKQVQTEILDSNFKVVSLKYAHALQNDFVFTAIKKYDQLKQFQTSLAAINTNIYQVNLKDLKKLTINSYQFLSALKCLLLFSRTEKETEKSLVSNLAKIFHPSIPIFSSLWLKTAS